MHPLVAPAIVRTRQGTRTHSLWEETHHGISANGGHGTYANAALICAAASHTARIAACASIGCGRRSMKGTVRV